jgi:ribosome-associated protein
LAPYLKEGQKTKSKDIAVLCAKAAEEKKASGIVALDVREVLFFADYFVICSGTNGKQLQAICDEMERQCKQNGVTKFGREGYSEGRWVLLDFGDVVAHIFLNEIRGFYQLEELWADAKAVDWEKVPAPRKPRKPRKKAGEPEPVTE